jgi:glycosyltransferase involved in cell wall biosynthesis
MNQLDVFILTAKVSEQDSVDKIDSTLISCYLSLFPNAKLVTLYNEQDKRSALFNFQENLKQILSSNHQLIIITNPYVYKHLFIRMLIKFSNSKNTIFLAHILGDFIKNSEQYLNLEDLLIGKQVVFIPPSKTYSNVIQPFFKNNKNLIPLHIPIPDSSLQNNKTNHSAELIFLYTGRIIAEKNLNKAYEILLSLNMPFKLVAVGELDDFSRSAILSNAVAGKLYASINKNIEILTHSNHEILIQHYQNADFFISLSTFHDESYGISPLEALFHDKPCILTTWGGFRDILNNFPDETFPITVKYQNGNYLFDYDLVALKKFVNFKKTINTNVISKSNYGTETFFSFIKNILNNEIYPFSGFSEKLENLVITNIKSKRISKLELNNGLELSPEEYNNIYCKMWD